MSIPGSLRPLASRPVVPAVVIATLALGLGVNTAIFSLTREVLLRPLPYRDADRLVRVFETSPALGRASAPTTPVHYIAWRERVDAFAEAAAFRRVAFNVALPDAPIQVEGFQVEPSFFPMLGIPPALGRGFADEDAWPGRDSGVLLGHGFWQRHYAADPAVLGRSIVVDGVPCTVVGVLPASFRIFRVLNREVELFRPLVLEASDREQSINVYAKLRPTASLEQARAQVAAAYAALPEADRRWSGDVALLSTSFAANAKPVLVALQCAAALVLLITCANVANLLLAASAGRRKELAIRQALGAGRWRIAADLAGETLGLTVAGAAAATVLASWIVALLNARVSFGDVNRLQPFEIDGAVLAFTAALTLAVTVAFALLPAQAASAVNLVDALKDSAQGVSVGPRNQRLRHGLVVGQLALSIVLTASALALTRSALALQGLGRGLRADHVMTAQVSLSHPRYADPARLARAASTVLDRLQRSPDVASAALVNYLPVSLIRTGVPLSIEGVPPPAVDRPWFVRYWVTSPDYFRTAGIPILAGRDFTVGDDATRPGVAIVSERLARRFWNGTGVLGRRLAPEFPASNAFWVPRARPGFLTVVGVVGDVSEDGLADAAGLPQVYLPYAQNPTTVLTLLARTTSRPPEALAPALREAVRAADPEAPVSQERSFEAVVGETFARPREMAWVVGAFAALALVLSAVGVYGVMAFATHVRAQEISIRSALGATPADVVSLVLGQASRLTAAGVALGVVLAPLALRLAGGLLFGVSPSSPGTLVSVAGLLAGVSLAASMIPALRAARRASPWSR